VAGDLKSAHVMSVFSFKRNFTLAQRHHETAKARLRELCQLLLRPHVAVERVPEIAGDIVESEAKAREYYERLLETHPNSIHALRSGTESAEGIAGEGGGGHGRVRL